MAIFDTHSHLYEKEFEEDRDLCLMRMAKLNISAMFVGFDVESSVKALELAKRNKRYFSSAGIHPSYASLNNQIELEKLEQFIQKNHIQALGEFGLDYYYDDAPDKDLQKELFIKQMNLALKYNLPVIIHTREAWQDTYDILKRYQGKVNGIIHCYTGSKEMAQEYIKLGYYIAIGGAVTFKNARIVKEVAASLPLERLVVETDCPYITPVPYRGKRNESAYIIYTLEEIALLRNMKLENLEDITFKNACDIFRIEADLNE